MIVNINVVGLLLHDKVIIRNKDSRRYFIRGLSLGHKTIRASGNNVFYREEKDNDLIVSMYDPIMSTNHMERVKDLESTFTILKNKTINKDREVDAKEYIDYLMNINPTKGKLIPCLQ